VARSASGATRIRASASSGEANRSRRAPPGEIGLPQLGLLLRLAIEEHLNAALPRRLQLNPVLARYLELIDLARELRGEPSAGELAQIWGWVCEEAEG
jgi:hypothetical protein